MDLWRVVDPVEGNDLLNSGVWRASTTGAEGKYFWGSLGDAQRYADAVKETSWGYDPPSIFSTSIDSALVDGPRPMDFGMPGYVVPNEHIGSLSPPVLVEIR